MLNVYGCFITHLIILAKYKAPVKNAFSNGKIFKLSIELFLGVHLISLSTALPANTVVPSK